MTLSPGLRKLALTVHVTASVGWLGAVAGFLALAVAGLTTENPMKASAAYMGMALVAWFVIVPLNIASLVSGVVQALGTQWGLFRHYWVVVKLIITLLATVILLLHLQPISYMGEVAATRGLSLGDLREIRLQLVVDAGAALVALLVTTALSVYKPQGLTRYGWRKQQQQLKQSKS